MSTTKVVLILSIALTAQLGLAAFLKFNQTSYKAQDPSEKLINIDLKSLDRITIEDSDSSKIDLKKSDDEKGTWLITTYHDFPAHGYNMKRLLDRFKSTKRGWIMANTAEARKRFRVANDLYDKKIVLGSKGKNLATLLIGKSSGLKNVNARIDGEDEIYEIHLPRQETTTNAVDWINKQYADLNTSKVILAQTDDYSLKKEGESWKLHEKNGKEHDILDETAQELIGRLAKVEITDVLGIENKPVYNAAKPIWKYNLETKKGQKRSYSLSKATDGDYLVMKADDLPHYLKLASLVEKRHKKLSPEWLLETDKNNRVAIEEKKKEKQTEKKD